METTQGIITADDARVVAYTYTVDGRTYHCTQVASQHYIVGGTVTVLYDIANPANAALADNRAPKPTPVGLGCGALILGMVTITIFFPQLLQMMFG